VNKKWIEPLCYLGFSVVFRKIIKIENVAERIGSVFGPFGREIGRKIDAVTKKLTLHID